MSGVNADHIIPRMLISLWKLPNIKLMSRRRSQPETAGPKRTPGICLRLRKDTLRSAAEMATEKLPIPIRSHGESLMRCTSSAAGRQMVSTIEGGCWQLFEGELGGR
jgi:hypothetical protein